MGLFAELRHVRMGERVLLYQTADIHVHALTASAAKIVIKSSLKVLTSTLSEGIRESFQVCKLV